MLGAIAGDIIGSPYESPERNIRTADFPLFTAESRFTDDTVLTVAVAECVMTGADYADAFREYFALYPGAGFGGFFIEWARSEEAPAYNSFGNGSAMRVSPVGFAYDTLEEVLAEAERSAAVTHNHPEGIKGAQATATATFLARLGADKKKIQGYIEAEFGYDLSEPLDSIREHYTWDVTCQGSVPQAIRAFLESEDLEDAIRKAVSIGGDSDTIACICGGIAHAFYGTVPGNILGEVLDRLDDRLLTVVLKFMDRYLPGWTD